MGDLNGIPELVDAGGEPIGEVIAAPGLFFV